MLYFETNTRTHSDRILRDIMYDGLAYLSCKRCVAGFQLRVAYPRTSCRRSRSSKSTLTWVSQPQPWNFALATELIDATR